MAVSVVPVQSRAELNEFIDYPFERYRGNSYWVPPLKMDLRALLDRRRHPFYRAAEAEFFLARHKGRVCGRIAAIHNRAHNEFHEDKTGFFGFFETEDNPDTARALLDTAADWCAARGLDALQGPMSPSTNYECAVLAEGFDRPPVFMMPYNPPSYLEYLEQAGFQTEKELLAYWLTDQNPFPEKLASITERVMRRSGLATRELRLNDLKSELEKIFAVYNDAWSRNWGFVPMSRAELETLADNLKWVCDPRIVFLAEKDDEPVGFLLGMPDLNRILPRLRGRLLPFGWYHLLRGKHRQNTLRVLAMGFRKEYQQLGFAAAIYRDIIEKGQRAGYHFAEISWVLDDNVLMNRAAAMLGAEVYKKYRIYGKPL